LQADPDYLRRHYASLSDEALRAIDRTDLVALAQRCYDEELARRGQTPQKVAERPAPQHTVVRRLDQLDDGEEPEGDTEISGVDRPEWLDEAACACAFPIRPGSDSGDAGAARQMLEAAGIPCHLVVHEIAPIAAQREYRLMVPGKFSMVAESILDQEIFNADMEAEWKTHFEELSDDELSAVDPEVLFGGLLDRIERVRKAYDEELTRRNLEARSGAAPEADERA
jgi:hypothetical protein